MINVSSDIVNTLGTNVGDIIKQLWPIFALIEGVIIGLYFARRIILLVSLIKR